MMISIRNLLEWRRVMMGFGERTRIGPAVRCGVMGCMQTLGPWFRCLIGELV